MRTEDGDSSTGSARGSAAWATEAMVTMQDLVRYRKAKTSTLIQWATEHGWFSLVRAELDARLGGPQDERLDRDPVVAADPDAWPPPGGMAWTSGPVYVGSVDDDAHNLAWGPRARMALTVDATETVVDLVEALLRAEEVSHPKERVALWKKWGDDLAQAIEAVRRPGGGDYHLGEVDRLDEVMDRRQGLRRVRAAAAAVDDEFRRAVRREILEEGRARRLMVFPPAPTAEIAQRLRAGEIDRALSMAAGYPILRP